MSLMLYWFTYCAVAIYPWLKYEPGFEETAEMKEPTLTVLRDGVPLFTSYGKWLHPLFELEDYLADHHISPASLVLQDKIIGKAAALLIHRLGFRTVKVVRLQG